MCGWRFLLLGRAQERADGTLMMLSEFTAPEAPPGMLEIAIENPTQADVAHAPGNRMALDNIRERLALYYDLEARLEIDSSANRFRVCISLPCRRKPA